MFWIIILAVVALDQLSKFFVANNLTEMIAVIPNVFYITYAKNTGVAFGMFQGNNTLFAIVMGVVILAIACYCYRVPSINTLDTISRGMVLGGAIGNLIDRIVRGYVVDFLYASFIDFPVFNIADSAISVGLLIHVLVFIFCTRSSSHQNGRRITF